MRMRYILDKNILTNSLKENADKRDDLCVTQDVLDEAGFTDQEITKIKKSGVRLLKLSKKHLEKLSEVMTANGNNLKLINLYTGKNTADVVIIAYVLCERDNPELLFTEEFTIVTNDKELVAVAKTYKINCLSQIPK